MDHGAPHLFQKLSQKKGFHFHGGLRQIVVIVVLALAGLARLPQGTQTSQAGGASRQDGCHVVRHGFPF
jgi:hypothetical protein